MYWILIFNYKENIDNNYVFIQIFMFSFSKIVWLLIIFYYISEIFISEILIILWFEYVFRMKNFVKNTLVSVALWGMSLLSNADNSFNNQKNLNEQTRAEISMTLNQEKENIKITPKVMTNAVINYFDEEVGAYKLKWESRQKVINILNSYFSNHSVLKVWNNWEMVFEIDNKREFIRTVKEVVNVILDDMPFLVRKMWVLLFFGWEWSLQRKLDNLDITMRDMKPKQYKSIVFDYIWGIVKRVAKSINWKMTVKDYYEDISLCFPNKNSDQIVQELVSNWNWNVDIKNLVYPFKK